MAAATRNAPLLEQEDHRRVGPAQPSSALDDGAEHDLDVGRRRAHRGQDLAGRGKVFAGLVKVPLQLVAVGRGVGGWRRFARHDNLLVPL